MSADTIRLHRVATGQGLPADGLSRQRNQRLHLFPGRALGEDELDRLQAWSDARIAALESALPRPGIVAGLDCRLHGGDGARRLTLAPGRGIGADGELYALDAPLEQDWVELRDVHRAEPDTPDAPLDGLYLVCLDARFFHLDASPDQAPCRRDELDRLRDARIARGLTLSLAAVHPSLWDAAEVETRPLTAANRFLGGLLRPGAILPDYDGVAVALAGVRDGALLWLDAAAGAFQAIDDPVHERLRAHLHHAFEVTVRGAARGDRAALLEAMAGLRPVWLPAAAELPPFLLSDPAGVNPLPRLDWLPPGAALDIQLLAESSLPVVLRASRARAATRFDALAGDHYRIGLVLADGDYRDDLLALPQLDPELPDLLRRSGILARNAGADAIAAWDRLAAGFDAETTPDYDPGFPVPERPERAEDPDLVLAALGDRNWAARTADADLEVPYSARWPEPAVTLPAEQQVPAEPPPGLLADAAAEQARQQDLTDMLADIDALLELLDAEKQQSRGLVDSLTIDLSQLAGGVAGDGSGLRIATVARQVDLSQKPGGGD